MREPLNESDRYVVSVIKDIDQAFSKNHLEYHRIFFNFGSFFVTISIDFVIK